MEFYSVPITHFETYPTYQDLLIRLLEEKQSYIRCSFPFTTPNEIFQGEHAIPKEEYAMLEYVKSRVLNTENIILFPTQPLIVDSIEFSQEDSLRVYYIELEINGLSHLFRTDNKVRYQFPFPIFNKLISRHWNTFIIRYLNKNKNELYDITSYVIGGLTEKPLSPSKTYKFEYTDSDTGEIKSVKYSEGMLMFLP